jgi:ABC-2 type transport system ATP-binding protein
MSTTERPGSAAGSGPRPSPPASDREGTTAVIRTEALTKTYAGSDLTAVDHLDLAVAAGEVFGLLGPNGAGKTTTAGMLTGRVIPTSGRATIAGIDVVATPALAKQIIGVVSQQNTLDRQLTVWENLYFHGRLFGISARESRRISDELLEKFNLSRWARASVYALSGGMAQRLMVARSIFHRPAVLFLDEPTAGLDPQSRLALWDILRQLNDEGQTIVLTTHYMEEADQLCDRVAIMDHGRILALDTPGELKGHVGADTIVTLKLAGLPPDAGPSRTTPPGSGPSEARPAPDTAPADTAPTEGALATLTSALQAAIPELNRTRQITGGLELHVRGATRLVPRVVNAAEDAGFTVGDVSVAQPSLEDVFIHLTGKELRD